MNINNNRPTVVVTGKARLLYVHLFNPQTNMSGSDPKYSVTILLPKSDLHTKQLIDNAVDAAKQAGIQKFGGVIPPIVAIPIHDGDGVRPSDGMPFGDECKGHWVFTASSKIAPQVVDVNVNPILDQSEVYSGMYGRVSVNFFAYNSNGKKGVGCGLNNVQKLADGEPLGGKRSAIEDFGQPIPQQVPTQNYQQVPQQVPTQNYQQVPQQNIDPITGQVISNVMGI